MTGNVSSSCLHFTACGMLQPGLAAAMRSTWCFVLAAVGLMLLDVSQRQAHA